VIVRAVDLEPPSPITTENFELICRMFHIPAEQRDEVRDFLADAVAGFREVMGRERTLPSRKEDRLALMRAIDRLRKAESLLKQIKGPAGRRALRLAGRQIAPAVSDAWMKRRFPNDFEAPSEVSPPAGSGAFRPSPRDSDWLSEAENRLLDYRIDFMKRRGGAALAKLIADEIRALEDGRRLVVALPVGRKPLIHRAYMLAALAQLWRRLGRPPTSGNSRFGAFCEVVFDTIGWPTEGVNSALASAIRLSRRLYR
jgi:hypothetical protein